MIPWPENGTKDRHSDSHSSSEKDEWARSAINYFAIPKLRHLVLIEGSAENLTMSWLFVVFFCCPFQRWIFCCCFASSAYDVLITFDVLATTKKKQKQTVAQTTTAQKKNAQRERDVVHLWSKPKLSIALYRVVRHDCDFIWNKRSTAMMQLWAQLKPNDIF